jgi:hypothetical protein
LAPRAPFLCAQRHEYDGAHGLPPPFDRRAPLAVLFCLWPSVRNG